MNTTKLFCLCLSFLISCGAKDVTTQEQDAERLNELFVEIETLASSVDCEDADNWTYTAFGSKACGGPVGYIAYSTEIDEEVFLAKIEEHRRHQNKFNEKWGVMSDCSVPTQPSGIQCENGEPVFAYE